MENKGSLITIKGTNHCLGDLIFFEGHGVYDPTHGRVDVTKEESELHNRALDKALLEGLDKNCEVGQGTCFYLGRIGGCWQVRTFVGTVVSTDVEVRGNVITFCRNGKTFRGRRRKSSDLFNFRRVV